MMNTAMGVFVVGFIATVGVFSSKKAPVEKRLEKLKKGFSLEIQDGKVESDPDSGSHHHWVSFHGAVTEENKNLLRMKNGKTVVELQEANLGNEYLIVDGKVRLL